jgi:acyl-CoA synthetase (AMP-forming)/AMP-acid ligase II
VSSPVVHANIAHHLADCAVQQPDVPALKIPRGRTARGDIDYLTLSFRELHAEVDAWCRRLETCGVKPGDRTLVMVKQGLPLIAGVFALFTLGAVPVIIDPGMGLKNFLNCVRHSRPRVLMGIPMARFVSRLSLRTFKTVQVRIPVSAALTGRLTKPNSASATSTATGGVASVQVDDLAAILFTSGSTGAPKGVCYEHGMFAAQVRMIRETYHIENGEIDLPLLPIFALFNPALGMTTVVPELDPRRPAAMDPRKIVQAIQQEKITNSFGSPTLWKKIGGYCAEHSVQLRSLRRVLCAGAPVPASLWAGARQWMPNGELFSPYGATEALPVSSVSASEIAQVSGAGACVGLPLAANTVKIIALTDAPIASLAATRELPRGTVGEIIVTGPSVTRTYDAAPAATAEAKIPAPSAIWHRMGDCGYLDDEGRLWFCGRRVERVETGTATLFTEPCEQVFRANPRATRYALIGLGPRGAQIPALVVEARIKGETDRVVFARALRGIAQSSPATREICRFYFHPKFPVDIRHNAKIHRLALARWAATERPYVVDP